MKLNTQTCIGATLSLWEQPPAVLVLPLGEPGLEPCREEQLLGKHSLLEWGCGGAGLKWFVCAGSGVSRMWLLGAAVVCGRMQLCTEGLGRAHAAAD